MTCSSGACSQATQLVATDTNLVSDDCSQAILEAGYEEDFLVSNVKIGLGSLT